MLDSNLKLINKKYDNILSRLDKLLQEHEDLKEKFDILNEINKEKINEIIK